MLELGTMKSRARPTGDPLWELATRITEKRAQPGDSIKSILRDLGQLYRGLKRLAPKGASSSPRWHHKLREAGADSLPVLHAIQRS